MFQHTHTHKTVHISCSIHLFNSHFCCCCSLFVSMCTNISSSFGVTVARDSCNFDSCVRVLEKNKKQMHFSASYVYALNGWIFIYLYNNIYLYVCMFGLLFITIECSCLLIFISFMFQHNSDEMLTVRGKANQ